MTGVREMCVCVCVCVKEREREVTVLWACLVELPTLSTMRLEESLSHFLLGHPVLFNYDDEWNCQEVCVCMCVGVCVSDSTQFQ